MPHGSGLRSSGRRRVVARRRMAAASLSLHGQRMPIAGSCHCGKIKFEIAGTIPAQLTRCTCTLCSKRGHLFAYYAPEDLKVIAESDDAIYRWQTKQVAHHFCSACGCGVYSDSPAFEPDGKWDGKTRRIGVNARLFDAFDAATAPVTVIDGKNLW